MPLSNLIERARRGDAGAIARLITRSLVDQGVVARGRWQGTELQLLLEGDEPIARGITVPIIRRGLRRLQLTCPIGQVQIVSRRVGQSAADWRETFSLDASSASDSAALALDSTATKDSDSHSLIPSEEGPEQCSRADPAATLISDNALLALAQLGPLFGYLTLITNGLMGFPFAWGGSTFLLPWRIVPPLVVLLVRGQDSPFVQQQSKHALNFQLSMVIYWLITMVMMFVLVGFLFVIPLALLELICIIIAAVKSSEGKGFKYPLAIPFVK